MRSATLLDWGRLLRLSLMPTAIVDVLAGLVYGAGGRWPGHGTAWLVLATLGVYHGALAWNDWNDRDHDGRTRPDRPIPSGRITPRAAFLAGAGLVALGVSVAFAVDLRAGWAYLGLAACALGYDLYGRGPWVGPALLAACRFANLGIAIVTACLVTTGAWPDPVLLAPAAGYGLYVFSLSRLGRLEDGEDGLERAHPRAWLIAAALAFQVLAIAPVVLDDRVGDVGGLLALAVGAFVLVRLTRLRPLEGVWTPAQVGRCMGVLLRLLLVCSGTVALLVVDGNPAAMVVIAAAAAGYPLSFQLRRVFPPS